MKHYYFLFALAAGLFLSAHLTAQQRCASYEVLKMQMEADPSFARKVKETEKSFDNYLRKTKTDKQDAKPGAITIPIVVHIVYNTAAQNISDEQIQSQIDVLNEDFTATNSDYNDYDAGYGAVKGDADIEFCLDTIVRKATTKKSFPFNDGVKKVQQGGSAAIDPMHKLNIWVCNLGQNLLGYAQFPGGSPETFGVVCHYRAFGSGEEYDLFEDYNLGRTTSHEVGHCFGLRHIWGDANCGNDFVDDTPLHNTANFGCPGEGHLSSCTGTPLEMWMDYMDYTDDRCMYFFTDGQVARMDFFIDSDPQINSIVNSSCNGGRGGRNNLITGVNSLNNSSGRFNQSNFRVYPSVTDGQLSLQFDRFDNVNAELNIYNQTGVLVMKQKIVITKGNSTRNLNVSNLRSGMYFLQLYIGTERKTEKFILQH